MVTQYFAVRNGEIIPLLTEGERLADLATEVFFGTWVKIGDEIEYLAIRVMQEKHVIQELEKSIVHHQARLIRFEDMLEAWMKHFAEPTNHDRSGALLEAIEKAYGAAMAQEYAEVDVFQKRDYDQLMQALYHHLRDEA